MITSLGITLMRIFLSMGLTEHTGHGVPTIVSHYGTSAFYIEENLIRCVIPFDPDVMEKSQKNVRINVGINVRINATQKKVLRLLIEDPGSTAASMSLNLGLSARTIQRALSALRDKGLIERDGSNRNGTWKVLKQI